jgi:preprotein translocase subunit SecY
MGVLKGFADLMKVKELRKRLFFTVMMLVVFRIGAHIPIPGINVSALSEYFLKHAAGHELLSLIDLFAGGALKRFTIFALGIMPYISAAIIMELLTVVIPRLQELKKEGEHGRRKINQYARYGTVLLCIIQSYGLTWWMSQIDASQPGVIIGGVDWSFRLMAILSITTGTMILLWIGELITERGIGNGVSLLIFAGIVVRAPEGIVLTINSIKTGKINPVTAILLVVLFFGVVAFSIMITEAARNVPVEHAKSIRGMGYKKATQVLPLKINPSGVMPIIFASSVMLFPSQVLSWIKDKSGVLATIGALLSPGQPIYIIVYALLIVLFSYYYTFIIFNPKDIADNMKKWNTFIPGIRPGSNTEKYLEDLMYKILLPGSLLLTVVAIFPDIMMNMFEGVPPVLVYLYGGTSLLIMVGVALDTLKQVESQLIMLHYEGFLTKGRIRGRSF